MPPDAAHGGTRRPGGLLANVPRHPVAYRIYRGTYSRGGTGADRTLSGPGGGHEDAGSATTDLVPGDDEEAMAKSQKGSRVESLLRA
ncbi:hypothetical protein GCM10010250_69070 [Streptomyces althioticus]|nr:hypothetical protein GCM10010250_69070 [Streptomyces althioticus]